MSFYGKVFKFQSAENHDDFLNSLGVPEDKLRFFTNFKSNQKIEKSGDNYIYTFSTPNGDMSLPFTSGVEMKDQNPDFSVCDWYSITIYITKYLSRLISQGYANRNKIKYTFTVDENRVTHVMKLDSGTIITVKKQFTPTKLVEEITNSNWNGVAYFTFHA